jgi:hypothetical protein
MDPKPVRARHEPSILIAVVSVGSIALSSCGSRSTLEFDPTWPAEPVDSGSEGRPPAGDAMADDVVDAKVDRHEAGPLCESSSISIEQLRPTVTLLVDQSGSMRERYPNPSSTSTRWSIVHDALMDPTTGVIKQLQFKLRFGIAFYTSHNGSSTGTCPIMGEVRAATNNYEAIRALYDRMTPDDDTPTGDAIDKVVEGIDSSSIRSNQTILLVTDGLPDTCARPDPQNGQPQAILAAQKAHADGIDLYVLGISADIGGQNLQELANAGKGQPINLVWPRDPNAAQPFQASDSVAGLTAQFRDVFGRIPFCEVRLSRNVEVSEASSGTVVLDGTPLSYGDPNGFILGDPRHLEIVGTACDTIKNMGKKLEVRISCD